MTVTLDEVHRAYKRLFATEDGKLVLNDLMYAHFIQGPLPLDNLQYAEGQRNVVLRILALAEKPLIHED